MECQPATTYKCGWHLQRQLLQDSESHVAIGYFAEVKYKQLNYVVSICGLLALICCAGMKVEKNKVLGHLSIKNQKKENKIADLGWT